MQDIQLEIVDGPDKPALQWAVTYPSQESVHFMLAGDAVDATIERMEEMADSFSFAITGKLISGAHKDQAFTGTYDVGSRSGRLKIAA